MSDSGANQDMAERSEVKRSAEYQEAYSQWRMIGPMDLNAEERMSREEAHSR